MFRMIIKGSSKVLYAISMALGFFLAIIILYNVILRYIFNKPTFWCEEVSSSMLIAITWFSAPEILRRGQHIRFDLFFDKLSEKGRGVVEIFLFMIGVIFCAILTWQGSLATYIVFIKHMSTPTVLGTPLFIPYLFLPLGAAFLAFHLLIKIVEDVKSISK